MNYYEGSEGSICSVHSRALKKPDTAFSEEREKYSPASLVPVVNLLLRLTYLRCELDVGRMCPLGAV
jgi:hypothetical protein